jgi:hypothetical protein
MHKGYRAVITAFCVTACGRPELASGVSDSAFVKVMGALRQLPVGGDTDSASRNRRRDSILRANGLSAAQLESAAVSLSADPKRASAVWRAIEQRGQATPK